MPNPIGKTRQSSNPYAVFEGTLYGEPVTYKVLKAYSMKGPKADPTAAAFLASSSPFTMGSEELGDAYLTDTIDRPGVRMVSSSPEFDEYLANRK